MKPFKTVLQEAESVDIINKSRFIAYVKAVDNDQDAQDFIAAIKKKHWDASHNVPVYCLGDQFQTQRYSDDGEPSGTAGVPILEMMKAEGITNTVIVVTRYFGGIKLGTGGLVRAYTQSAKHALSLARVVDKVIYEKFSIVMEYHHHGKCQNYFLNHPTFVLADTLFTDSVTIIGYLPSEDVEGLQKQINDLTSAMAVIETLGEEYLTLENGLLVKEDSYENGTIN